MFLKNESLAQNSATRDIDNEQALYCHLCIHTHMHTSIYTFTERICQGYHFNACDLGVAPS